MNDAEDGWKECWIARNPSNPVGRQIDWDVLSLTEEGFEHDRLKPSYVMHKTLIRVDPAPRRIIRPFPSETDALV